MRLVFFPFQFPPTKGGIATWLYSVCTNLRDDDVSVLVEKIGDCQEFDEQQTFKILRKHIDKDLKAGNLHKLVRDAFAILIKRRARTNKKVTKDVISCIFHLNHRQFNYVISMLSLWMTEPKLKETEVVFCGYALPAGIIALLQKFFYDIPYVVFVHGMEIFSCQRTALEKKLMNNVLRNANKLIANSHYTSKLVLSTFEIDEDKITVIHPGADFKTFASTPDVSRLKRHLNVGNEKIILTVGNLVERKGQDMVLKALPKVLKEFPDLKYLVVGEGDYRARLQSYIEEYHLEKNVFLVGSVPDKELPAYYHLCDIFVMPGRIAGVHVEGFGIAFVEASASSKPVIGGRSGGVEDAILDGVTGFLVEPENEDEICGAILKILNDKILAARLGTNGRKRVEKELTWQIGARKIRKVAEEVSTKLLNKPS